MNKEMYISDEANHYRQRVNNGNIVLDEALTDLGFNGTEDTDWRNISYSKEMSRWDIFLWKIRTSF